MSRNKFNRSMDGSRAEAVRIYNQRKTLNRLEKQKEALENELDELKTSINNLKEIMRMERKTALSLNQVYAVSVIDRLFFITDDIK